MKGNWKKLLLAGIVLVEVISAVLAWRDLGSRSDDQVRGNKKTWRVFIVLNPGNSLAYWIFGRSAALVPRRERAGRPKSVSRVLRPAQVDYRPAARRPSAIPSFQSRAS